MKRKSESSPLDDYKYLKVRIGEEREKAEKTLYGLGQYEANIDWLIEAYEVVKFANIEPDESIWPGSIKISSVWRESFDHAFPPAGDPSEKLRNLSLLNSTAGSAGYNMVTGSANHIIEVTSPGEYYELVHLYEVNQEERGVTSEIIRKLGWLSESAAEKYKAAWESFYASIPSTDPSSGPAMAIRSALDLAIRSSLLERTPKPHPEQKKEYLLHISDCAARNQIAKEILRSQAVRYGEITDRLSKVKGVTDLDRLVLKTLFFESQDFLSIVLDAIDIDRLLPKKELKTIL